MPLNMIDGLYQGENLEKAKEILRKKEAARKEFESGMEDRSWCFVGEDEIQLRKSKYNKAMWEIEKEESQLNKRIRRILMSEMNALVIVLEAEKALYQAIGEPPSVEQLSRHIGTSTRCLKIFLMRHKDNVPLKDVGMAFDIGTDRVTQLLHRFNSDLFLFYLRKKNNEEDK